MKNSKHKVELMAPVGSYEAYTAAINAGCDSIYFGITQLNMRARAAANFTLEDLAKIALMTAKTVKMFGMDPVIAMVSFSNFGSSSNYSSSKIREAVAYLHKYYPDLIVDGELQTDFALNKELLQEIFPFSKLAGKKVNTLIFPNLDAANITYKLLKELNKSESIGPIILGLEKPVHVFQLGASVEEMVNMAAVAVVDAQENSKKQL